MFSLCSLFPMTFFWPDLPKSLAKISQRPENRKDWSKWLMILSLAPFLKEREIQIRIFFWIVPGRHYAYKKTIQLNKTRPTQQVGLCKCKITVNSGHILHWIFISSVHTISFFFCIIWNKCIVGSKIFKKCNFLLIREMAFIHSICKCCIFMGW